VKRIAAAVMLASAVSAGAQVAEDPAKPAFSIYFTSEVRGEIDPCG